MDNLVTKQMARDTRKRSNYMVAVLSILCLCLFTYVFTQWQQNGSFLPVWEASDGSDEETAGVYYTLYDSASGEMIEYMSRRVYSGDELLTGDNRYYRVERVDGHNAYCELLGECAIEQVLDELYSGSVPTVSTGAGTIQYDLQDKDIDSISVGTRNFQSVAIYCTHTDESYVPTSGTESKHGGGDILDVAETMVTVLENQGVSVIHSDNLHDPHDVNAYQRSRKTAAELLRGAPAAIIDVHRDGIPDPEYYATTLDGKEATQIRIVVGRQNQNSEANIAFAEKMKAYYDDVKPGLIKSIFMAKGNYNQDLAPNSVLLEIGTHTNTLEAAQNGAKEFAEVLPQFLGLKTVSDKNTASEDKQNHASGSISDTDSGTGKAIVLLLLAIAIGGAIYLFVTKCKGRV